MFCGHYQQPKATLSFSITTGICALCKLGIFQGLVFSRISSSFKLERVRGTPCLKCLFHKNVLSEPQTNPIGFKSGLSGGVHHQFTLQRLIKIYLHVQDHCLAEDDDSYVLFLINSSKPFFNMRAYLVAFNIPPNITKLVCTLHGDPTPNMCLLGMFRPWF